jgi:aminoglycoside N3'-acetyltransferase/acyl carrier protein
MEISKSNTQKLKQLLEQVLEIEDISCIDPHTHFSELMTWDSLNHMSIIAHLQSIFGIKIGFEELQQTFSIASITQLIENKLSNTANIELNQTSTFPTWLSLFEHIGLSEWIKHEKVIYIHSRYQAIAGLCAEDIDKLINTLLFQCGEPKTLVFPLFPFTAKSYQDYIERHPTFIAEKNIPQTGLIAQQAMNRRDAFLSMHPVFPECGIGPEASDILKDAHKNQKLFHPNSSYQKLYDRNATVLGLGVDLNTNAFIHMADEPHHTNYPKPIYLETPVSFDVSISKNDKQSLEFQVYQPGVHRRLKPNNLDPEFAGKPFYKAARTNEATFYALNLQPFISECTALAKESVSQNQLPPWFI